MPTPRGGLLQAGKAPRRGIGRLAALVVRHNSIRLCGNLAISRRPRQNRSAFNIQNAAGLGEISGRRQSFLGGRFLLAPGVLRCWAYLAGALALGSWLGFSFSHRLAHFWLFVDS
jgi:hypothetical protein